MNIDFKVYKTKYEEKTRRLDVKASGSVKSNKFFPVFNINNKEYIFKPLSKTKPLTTGLFSYAEVVWSYITNRYFCEAPIYRLAICEGYEEAEGKYYDNGCLVANILEKDEHLVNLYEYYRDNPDKKVRIKTYINYCMKTYDYTKILESKIFKENEELAKELAMQILLSILKADQNFHYENVAFICDEKNNIKSLAPMLDHEFSTMFLFAENPIHGVGHFNEFVMDLKDKGTNYKNLKYICKNYPEVALKFLESLKEMLNDISKLTLEDNGFLFDCNSFSYEIGIARYKENNEEKAKELEKDLKLSNINLEAINLVVILEIQKIGNFLVDFIEKNSLKKDN